MFSLLLACRPAGGSNVVVLQIILPIFGWVLLLQCSSDTAGWWTSDAFVQQVAIVVPFKNTDSSLVSDKGKRPTAAAPVVPLVDSVDDSFCRQDDEGRMEETQTWAIQMLPHSLHKGLRGASSGDVGYMSQLVGELLS